MPSSFESLVESIGVPIAATLPVESDLIVLFDCHGASQKHVWDNLMRVRPDAIIVWRASPPSSTDRFTKVDRREGNFVAWTWEGFMVSLDPVSGRILESTFVK